jgi:DNA-binding transcriptional regulator LsrR (DeoR family)
MPIRSTDQVMHKAAWLYYMHGLRQDEVAKQLDISRASVALYLRRARESGIVNISTSTSLFTHETLARELEDALGIRRRLDRALKIACHGSGAGDAGVAAAVFLELINKGDRIGVAWGKTVYHMADVMPLPISRA